MKVKTEAIQVVMMVIKRVANCFIKVCCIFLGNERMLYVISCQGYKVCVNNDSLDNKSACHHSNSIVQSLMYSLLLTASIYIM